MKALIKHIALLVFAALPFIGFAQGEIDDAEIVIEKNLKIELPPASREFYPLNLEKREVKSVETQTYDTKKFSLPLAKENPKTKMLMLQPEKLDKLYPAMTEIGFGNYGTSLLDIYYANKRSKTHAYGLNFNHLASFVGPVENSGISDNRAKAYFQKFINTKTLSADLNYDFNKYKYYGYNHDSIVVNDADSITQKLNKIGINLAFKETKDNLNYQIDAFSDLTTLSFFREQKNGYNFAGKYKLNDEFSILAKSDFTYDIVKKDTLSNDRMYFKFEPSVSYVPLENLKVIAGFNISGNNDTLLWNKKSTHFYPLLNAVYTLESMQFYTKFSGELERNNFEKLIIENPYLDSVYTALDNNKMAEFVLGARLNGKLSLDGNLQLKSYENLHNFTVSALDTTRFAIEWNTGNTSILNINLGANYTIIDKFEVGAQFSMNSYNLDSLEKASYRPKYTTAFFLKHYVSDKVKTELSVNHFSGLYSYNPISDDFKKINNIVDVNLKISYFMSEKLGLYIRTNNLISRKYQYFLNYPKKGINFIAGINYVF